MTPNNGKQTILVVDDTPENIDVLSGVLRPEYKVKAAITGENALKIVFGKTKPDIILLDIMMPGMDGYEVCRQLKENPATADIPVIFITAKNQVEDEKLGLELGAVDYITKPISPALVMARVKNHLTLKANSDFMRDALAVISSSISYASRIQRSVLPDASLMDTSFNDYFVYWKPRDVVSGDIYWCRKWADGVLFILGDCTGHGVPGAFMTLIATGALDLAELEVPAGDVAQLIQRMHQLVQTTLEQHKEGGESDDGLELGACFIPADKNRIYFSGARFELFEVLNGAVTQIKGTKMGIGYRHIDYNQTYETREIELKDGASFYLTSDGFTDQVGGERRRMFGKKQFSNLLGSFQDKPMAEQKDLLHQAFLEYMGNEKQRDDVSVIGFKLHD